MFMKKPKTKEVVAVFLTESGHSPNEKTMRHYFGVFRANKEITGGAESVMMSSNGGPNTNQSAELIQMMEKERRTMILAVFIDDTRCGILGVNEGLIDNFIAIAKEFPHMTSWQIATQIAKQATQAEN
jgi:hypothetical protein